MLNLSFVSSNAAVAILNFTAPFLSGIDNGFFPGNAVCESPL